MGWKAEFLLTTESGQETIGTIYLNPNNSLTWSEDFPEKVRKELELHGTKIGKTKYTVKDGIKFLQALTVTITGNYLRVRLSR